MNSLPILKDLHIRITSKCNMNCPHCYAADWFRDNVQLDFVTISKLVKEAINLGCRKVTFTVWEPLVSEFLTDSIQFCLSKNLRVEVESNGMLIDHLENKLGDCMSRVEFAISYDGEKMRGNKQAEIVRKNIEKLINIGCDVNIQTVITNINEDEIDHIFGFSEKLNIRNRVFLAHSPNGNGKDISLRKINDWLKTVSILKEKYKHVIIELPDIFSGGGQKNAVGVRCEVMPNGDVTSCAPITFNKRAFIAGNIKEMPLKEIWASRHFYEIPELHQSDFKGLCAKCMFWKTCLGACRSISFSTGGDLLSHHPFCIELFDGIKNKSVDMSSFSGDIQDIIHQWISNIESPHFNANNERYEDIVKAQHKLL